MRRKYFLVGLALLAFGAVVRFWSIVLWPIDREDQRFAAYFTEMQIASAVGDVSWVAMFLGAALILATAIIGMIKAE